MSLRALLLLAFGVAFGLFATTAYAAQDYGSEPEEQYSETEHGETEGEDHEEDSDGGGSDEDADHGSDDDATIEGPPGSDKEALPPTFGQHYEEGCSVGSPWAGQSPGQALTWLTLLLVGAAFVRRR